MCQLQVDLKKAEQDDVESWDEWMNESEDE